MRIDIALVRADQQQWLLLLKQRFETEGHSVFFQVRDTGAKPSSFHSLVFQIERFVFNRGGAIGQSAPLPDQDLSPLTLGGAPDLLIALSEGNSRNADLTLFLDGKLGMSTLLPSLLAGHIPYIELRNREGRIVAAGLPALEQPDTLIKALDDYLSRLVSVLERAVSNFILKRLETAKPGKSSPRSRNPIAFVTDNIFRRVRGRLGLQPPEEHWRVGIRFRRAGEPFEGDRFVDGFAWIRDDAQRYYADPFLFEEAGEHFVFVEEFPLLARKGILSVAQIGEDAQVLDTPRPIIECAGHLSYPYLFRLNGEIYLMAENSAEKRLPLFRARRFPHDWEFVGNLLEGIGIHDATPLVHEDGRVTLFGTIDQHGGTSWDCLALFEAETLLGPYRPLQHNPVLIDGRFARPGGAMLHENGRLVRPVQHCLPNYGRFLRFLEVRAFSDGVIEQVEIGRLLPPAQSRIAGVHSYSRSSKFEAVDAHGFFD